MAYHPSKLGQLGLDNFNKTVQFESGFISQLLANYNIVNDIRWRNDKISNNTYHVNILSYLAVLIERFN